MGKRWIRLRAMRVVSQLVRGETGGFRKLVADLEDEEIEEFLQDIDTAMGKKERVSLSPVIQAEYAILVEERTRRENGRQEAE